MSLIRGIRAGYPSGVIRAEGSERKDSSVGNRAEGSKRMDPSRGIRAKRSERRDMSGRVPSGRI